MQLELNFPKEGDNLFPYLTVPIPAGTAHEIEQVADYISLDEFVRAELDNTYYLRVRGDSMNDADIFDGDLLVVMRCETARQGDIIIAEINGEFTVKKFKRQPVGLYLVPANANFEPQKLRHNDLFRVWGKVTFILRKLH